MEKKKFIKSPHPAFSHLLRPEKVKSAFTLAEVLITLGIIGVVAALTIPTLVANYQTKAWSTAASTFEARFGEALKVMNTQQVLANLGTTERFVDELQKQMKISKVCDNTKLNECFTEEINGSRTVVDVADSSTYQNNSSTPTNIKNVKTAAELGQKDWGTNTMGLMFANGVAAVLAYNPKCSANPYDNNSVQVTGNKNAMTFSSDCVAMIYDTSGFGSPNEKDKDIRLSSMASIGDGACSFKINGTCVTKIISTVGSVSKAECESMIQTHGIKACSAENDYWAGAVKACGGVDKVLDTSDYWRTRNFIYNDGPMGYSYFNYDDSRAAQLGFPAYDHAKDGFFYWAANESSATQSIAVYYWKDTIRNVWNYDRASGVQGNKTMGVICKE